MRFLKTFFFFSCSISFCDLAILCPIDCSIIFLSIWPHFFQERQTLRATALNSNIPSNSNSSLEGGDLKSASSQILSYFLQQWTEIHKETSACQKLQQLTLIYFPVSKSKEILQMKISIITTSANYTIPI